MMTSSALHQARGVTAPAQHIRPTQTKLLFFYLKAIYERPSKRLMHYNSSGKYTFSKNPGFRGNEQLLIGVVSVSLLQYVVIALSVSRKYMAVEAFNVVTMLSLEINAFNL